MMKVILLSVVLFLLIFTSGAADEENIFLSLELAELPSTLEFNRNPTIGEEYSWGVFIDTDNNENTGSRRDGSDVWISLSSYYDSNTEPYNATIDNGTKKFVRIYSGRGWSEFRVPVECEVDYYNQKINMVIPYSGVLVSIDENDRFYFTARHGFARDTTGVSNGNATIDDPEGDVFYKFIDIIKGSLKISKEREIVNVEENGKDILVKSGIVKQTKAITSAYNASMLAGNDSFNKTELYDLPMGLVILTDDKDIEYDSITFDTMYLHTSKNVSLIYNGKVLYFGDINKSLVKLEKYGPAIIPVMNISSPIKTEKIKVTNEYSGSGFNIKFKFQPQKNTHQITHGLGSINFTVRNETEPSINWFNGNDIIFFDYTYSILERDNLCSTTCDYGVLYYKGSDGWKLNSSENNLTLKELSDIYGTGNLLELMLPPP